MLNMSRVLSKLTVQSACRASLAAVDGLMPRLMAAVMRHRRNLPLAHRLLFTLGNMTASDVESRSALYDASGQAEDLLVLLASYSTAAVSSSSIPNNGSPPSEENDDVLTKLIRVIANLCINPDIGFPISQSEHLTALIELLRHRRAGCSEDLVLHIVGAINNISCVISHAHTRHTEISHTHTHTHTHRYIVVIQATDRRHDYYFRDCTLFRFSCRRHNG